MFDKIAINSMYGLQAVLEDRLSKMPEGLKKERLKKIVLDFVPMFKRALKDGDVNGLQKLQRAAKEIEDAGKDTDVV